MPDVGFNIQIENRDGIQLVHVSGILDYTGYDQFRNLLIPLVDQPHARVVLDCANLTYVNSKGLVLMVRCHRTATQNQSFFGIAALRARILKAIAVLGMGKLVELYPSVEEAMQAAAAR
jgi:anti-sigma B factor antagonist